MELGLFNLMSYKDNARGIQGVIQDTRSMVSLAEEIGFSTAWFAEHHFTNYSISVSPLLMAAHMAGYSRRIRLGTAVVVLPLYEPMRLAQEIALVDRLLEGRLVLGIGIGYQAYEFERYRQDVTQRNALLLSHWDFIERALTDGHAAAASWQGEQVETDFLLTPLQSPLPPLYLTTTQPQVLKRFAHLGATPFMTAGWRGSARLSAMGRDARVSWGEAGLDAQMPVAVQQYIHVTDSHQAALAAAERALFVARMIAALHDSRVKTAAGFITAPPFQDEPPAEVIRDNLIIGDAHWVAERVIREVREINPSHYNCFFQFGDMPIADARRSLEKFGQQVIPLLEKELGSVTVITLPRDLTFIHQLNTLLLQEAAMPDISQRIDCVTDECAAIIETIKRQQSEQAAYASTLPAQAYNSEAFFEYEMEKVFRTDWLFVGHVSQIPAEGDYFTLNIVKEPLVVIRHQQQVRVMSSVCLHRWVPVVTGEGNAKALVCPFHNWTYDTGGQLIGTPYMNQAAEFDRHSCSLPQIRSEIVHGMIFITFSDSVESIADRLRPLNALLDKYQVADLHTAYTLDYDCPFNWKMAVETFMECYHHSAVHRTTLEDSFPGRLSYIGEDGLGWTLCHQPLRKNGDIAEVLPPGLIPLSGFSEQDMRQIDLMLIYPTCLIGLNPDRLSISTLLPEDCHSTRWHRLVLVSKASAAQPDFAATAAEMKNGSLGIIDEDLGINAAQKIGSRSRMARPGRLGHLETTVWHLANYLRRRL